MFLTVGPCGGSLIWVPFLGFWLLSPGDMSRSRISPAQAQIRRKLPPHSPSMGSPWLSGGEVWLKKCILSVSRKHKQFEARREGPGSLLPAGRLPWELHQRHGGHWERENSWPVGLGAGGRFVSYEWLNQSTQHLSTLLLVTLTTQTQGNTRRALSAPTLCPPTLTWLPAYSQAPASRQVLAYFPLHSLSAIVSNQFRKQLWEQLEMITRMNYIITVRLDLGVLQKHCRTESKTRIQIQRDQCEGEDGGPGEWWGCKGWGPEDGGSQGATVSTSWPSWGLHGCPGQSCKAQVWEAQSHPYASVQKKPPRPKKCAHLWRRQGLREHAAQTYEDQRPREEKVSSPNHTELRIPNPKTRIHPSATPWTPGFILKASSRPALHTGKFFLLF